MSFASSGAAGSSATVKDASRDKGDRRRSSLFSKVMGITPVPEEEVVVPPTDIEDFDLMDDVVDCIRQSGAPDQLILDRRYRLRSFPACLIGKKLVTWFLEHFYKNTGVAPVLTQHGIVCPDRASAVRLCCRLWDARLLRHVTRDWGFQDGDLFYRLREHEGADRKKVPDDMLNLYLAHLQSSLGHDLSVNAVPERAVWNKDALLLGSLGFLSPVRLLVSARNPTMFVFRSASAGGKKLKLLGMQDEYKRLTGRSGKDKEAAAPIDINTAANPMPVISAAIRKGVPLFNAGQDEACYDVYRLATLELLGRPEFETHHELLRKAVADADKADDASSRAWALRKAFDVITMPYLLSKSGLTPPPSPAHEPVHLKGHSSGAAAGTNGAGSSNGSSNGDKASRAADEKDKEKKQQQDKDRERDKDANVNAFLVPMEVVPLSNAGYSLAEIEVPVARLSQRLLSVFESCNRPDVKPEQFGVDKTLKIHLLFLHFGSNAITQQLCFAFNSLQDRDDLMTLLVSLKVEYRLRPETRIDWESDDKKAQDRAPVPVTPVASAFQRARSQTSQDMVALGAGGLVASPSQYLDGAASPTNAVTNSPDDKAKAPRTKSDDDKKSEPYPILSFTAVLDTPQYRHLFGSFLDENLAGESMRFLNAVEGFKTIDDDAERQDAGLRLYKTFIGPKAAEQINVASDHYRAMEQHVQKKEFSSDMFDEAYADTVKLLRADSFVRWCHSDDYKELIDVLGLRGQTGRAIEAAFNEKRRDKVRLANLTAVSFRRRPSFSVAPMVENLGDLDALVEAIDQAGLVKDRRYHFKKYASCLTGVALVDWLVTNKYATNRLAAIGIGQRLMDSLLLRHVTDEQPFLDDSSMYRFSPLDSEGRERYPKLGPPPLHLCVSVAELIWSRDQQTHDGYVLLKGVRYVRLYVVLTGGQSPGLYLFRSSEHMHAEAVLALAGARCTVIVNDSPTSFSSACYLQLQLPPSQAPTAMPAPSPSSMNLDSEAAASIAGPSAASVTAGSSSGSSAVDANAVAAMQMQAQGRKPVSLSSPVPTDKPGSSNLNKRSPSDGPKTASAGGDESVDSVSSGSGGMAAAFASPNNVFSTDVFSRIRPRFITFRVRREEKARWMEALQNVGIAVSLKTDVED